MKNLITILCLCLFWFSCGDIIEEVNERYGDGKLILYYENGKIKKERNY